MHRSYYIFGWLGISLLVVIIGRLDWRFRRVIITGIDIDTWVIINIFIIF